MNRHLAALGVFALVTGCATSAPEPAPVQELPTSDAAIAADSTEAAPGMRMRMRMHAPDSAGPAMEGMHHERGMHRGEGGMGQGQGMEGMGRGMGMSRGMHADSTPMEVPPHLQEGERIFRDVCAQCHSMDPPARLAPPMSHVARHLRSAFDTEAAALAHLKEYIRSPDAERSVMPARAVERFGLMPAQPLPDEILDPVGRYIWYLGGG